MKISVVVLTKNEEENIGRCLESVSWADELIIIDDYSEDRTVEIAEKYGAKVYKRHLKNDFAGQRNFGMSVCSNEWVLFLDSDEVLESPLSHGGLRSSLKNPKGSTLSISAFRIWRRDFLWGRELKYGEVGDVKLSRLVRKGTGKWVRRVHEEWETGGDIRDIGGIRREIRHYPHKNVGEFLRKIRRYALMHAEELEREGVKAGGWQVVLYPLGKFLYNYIWKKGFLDGTEGFVHAAMMSFHSFVARSELWLRHKRQGYSGLYFLGVRQ